MDVEVFAVFKMNQQFGIAELFLNTKPNGTENIIEAQRFLWLASPGAVGLEVATGRGVENVTCHSSSG